MLYLSTTCCTETVMSPTHVVGLDVNPGARTAEKRNTSSYTKGHPMSLRNLKKKKNLVESYSLRNKVPNIVSACICGYKLDMA